LEEKVSNLRKELSSEDLRFAEKNKVFYFEGDEADRPSVSILKI